MRSPAEVVSDAYDRASRTRPSSLRTHEHAHARCTGTDRPCYCDGAGGGCGIAECDTCDEVVAAAEVAEKHASSALANAEAGRWNAAIRAAEAAEGCEGKYGDAPTWGPFRRVVTEEAARARVVHRVLLVASYDATQAGLCSCDDCLARYERQYGEALEAEADKRGLRVELVCAQYGSQEAYEVRCDDECPGDDDPHADCFGLGKDAHDGASWSDEECECEECEEERA